MENFLIQIVKSTDGWVIVVVALLYFGYETFKAYRNDNKFEKTIEVVRELSVNQINRIEQALTRLTNKFD